MKQLKAEDLTQEQLNYLYNGIGSEELGVYVPKYCFENPARLHDAAYLIGNTEIDRWKADFNFLTNCVKEIHKRKIYQFLIPAVFYYLVLMVFGWLVFEYGEEIITWKELKAKHDGLLKSRDGLHKIKRELKRFWSRLRACFNRL